MNQKETTVQTVIDVLQSRNVEYVLNGDIPVKEVLTDLDKTQIRTILFNKFRNGEVSYKPEFQDKVDDDQELKKYVSGLLNNWIRKAKEFNSGQTYQTKNPGSRSSDEQMKELKKLYTQVKIEGDTESITMVENAIEIRKSEINQVHHKPINVDVLPDTLKHLVK